MNKNQAKAFEIVSLPNQDYFNITSDKILTLQSDLAKVLRGDTFPPPPSQMNEPKATTYALGAPETVDLEKIDNLNVLFAAEESGLRRWQVDQEQNLHLAIVSHTHGTLSVRRYNTIPEGKRQSVPQPSRSGQEPQGRKQTAILTGVIPMDLLSQFGSTLPQGRYSITVLIYDMATNTETFDVINSKTPVEVLNKNLQVSSFVSVSSAEVQHKKGEKIHQVNNQKIQLFSPINHDIAPLQTEGGATLFQASLALLKRDSEESHTVNMLVPVTSEQQLDIQWEMDVKQALKDVKLNGDYQAYLFVGGSVSAPTQLHFD